MTTYERKQIALVFITITMIFQFQMKVSVGCVETEKMGLLQLKSYFKNLINDEEEGEGNGILNSWTRNGDCCLWERVKCNDAITTSGHVTDLSLDRLVPVAFESQTRSLNLSLFHSFPQLQSLNLSWNWFTGLSDHVHGYKSIGRLEKLTTIDLSHNLFDNSIVPFLSAATSLRTLHLESNYMDGVFPPKELGNMTKLRVLNLKDNSFSFLSVQGLSGFRELEVLNLSLNGVNDSEASHRYSTAKLKTLDLSYNLLSDFSQLKGLENLRDLAVLRLRGNQLNHTLSTLVLKDLNKLQELDLSDNGFTNLDHGLGLLIPTSLQVLDLKENRLSLTHEGYLGICRLVNLRELDLSSNVLTTLPYCLSNITRLRTLDLSNNQLNGNLTSFVSGLPSAVEYLSLLDNNFNGSFLLNSLVNQTRLTIFKLSSKVGMIQVQADSFWAPLFQLRMLHLSNCNLGSTMLGFLVHQRDLCFVDLSHNNLTGTFPTWLVKNNTRLQTMLLSRNSLTRLQLPMLVHGLKVLDISSNMIYDSIQEEIGIVFPNLRYMNISSNHFRGTIPSSIGEMKSLQVLDMSSNGLYGQLPQTFLSGCYSLKVLKLSNNQLQGEIFSKHANLTGLVGLFLDGNNFTGNFEKGLLKSKNLTLLDISDNRFSGMLPLWIGSMSSLSYLYMSGNQLKGPFPHQLQSLSQFEVMDISHNSFSGSIPRNVNFPFLRELRLQNNEFMGSVPDTLFKAVALEVLDMRNNNLSGNILNTVGKTSKLRVLLLRNNSFQTYISKKICQLSEVGLLDLSHNKFKGAIPSCFGNMSFGAEKYDRVTSLDADFDFSYITFLRNCQYASRLNLADSVRNGYQPKPATIVDFLTKSRYEAYHGDILGYMYGLDLSNNQLSGEVPVEIGDLQNIRSLNLSSNRLTGSIPDSISKLKDLESLDLSNNRLDGSIPPVLADLNSLGYLNISYNSLSGEIPFKGHLVTFNERSYIGNARLCGLPTNKSCNSMRVPEPSASKQATEEEEEEEGDDVIDMVWFYWTCGAVYISTSLALFAFLCIDSRWSREWFYRVDLSIHYLQRFKRSFLCN